MRTSAAIEGRRPGRGFSFVNRYMDALFDACVHDGVIANRASRVVNLTSPAHSLVAPNVLARVTAHALLKQLRLRTSQGQITPYPEP
jgi:tRNA A37 threonylcarbamoyladenosine synthetase subunit TsaC/SUA5/YrdC